MSKIQKGVGGNWLPFLKDAYVPHAPKFQYYNLDCFCSERHNVWCWFLITATFITVIEIFSGEIWVSNEEESGCERVMREYLKAFPQHWSQVCGWFLFFFQNKVCFFFTNFWGMILYEGTYFTYTGYKKLLVNYYFLRMRFIRKFVKSNIFSQL